MPTDADSDQDRTALISQEEQQQLSPEPSLVNGTARPFTANGNATSSNPVIAISAPEASHIGEGSQNGDNLAPAKFRYRSSRTDRARLTVHTKLRFMTTTTSFDGLRFMDGTPRTIIWLLIFILSVIAMSFVLWFITDAFLARNTTFSRVKIFPASINFPAITICNHNPYYDIDVYDNEFDSLPNETQVTIFYEYYRKDRIFEVNTSRLLEIINDTFSFNIFTEEFNPSVNVETILREHGHKLQEDNLVSCNFDGTPCSVDDFVEVVTAFGLCYTFNLNNSRSVSSAGTSHGLSLVINIEQYRYMYYTSHTAGLQVFVHPQDEYPYSGEYHGFSVSPGFETQVAISLTNTELKEPPYGQCGERSIHDSRIIPCTSTPAQLSDTTVTNSSNSTGASDDDTMQSMMKCPQPIKRYTRQRCLDECEVLYQNRECGCKADYLPGADIRVCNLNELFNCLLKVTDQFATMKNTLCDCPVECNRVQYNTKLSSSYFPAIRYPLVSGASQQAIRVNMLSLLFYYDKLEYTEVTQEINFDTFRYLADFGSHLGLFTGAGVLSFFELFELCLY